MTQLWPQVLNASPEYLNKLSKAPFLLVAQLSFTFYEEGYTRKQRTRHPTLLSTRLPTSMFFCPLIHPPTHPSPPQPLTFQSSHSSIHPCNQQVS